MNWLDKIVMFFGCIIEVFLLYDYFNNFFLIKLKAKYTKAICISTCITLYLINLVENTVINLVFVPLLLWIFICTVFDAKIGLRIAYFVAAYAVMMSLEFLYILLSNTTAKLLLKTGLIPGSEYAWQLIFVKFLNFIIFMILKQTSSKSTKRMTNGLFYIYMIIPITTMGTMLTVFYSGFNSSGNFNVKVIMTIFFACMLVGNIASFYAFQSYAEKIGENMNQKLELLRQKAELERLMKITELNEIYNETIHDMTHYLKTIGELAYQKKNNEIEDIVEKLIGKLHIGNIIEYSNIKILNTILSEYNDRAKKERIIFDAYVEPGCRLEYIKDIDLVTMLGNIFDNAIRAAMQKGHTASVIVRIFMQKEGRICIIKVVNDFSEKLRTDKGKLITTKSEKGIHGIGISSITKIAKQYEGYFEYYVENDKFNAIIVLPAK